VKILNTHIGTEEHDWLRAEAKRQERTITAVVRGLIRQRMAFQEIMEERRKADAAKTRKRLVAGR